jgi:hypothetical protein
MKKSLGMFFGLPRWGVGAVVVAFSGLFAWQASASVMYNFTFSDISAGGSDAAHGQLLAQDNGAGTVFTFVSGFITVDAGGASGFNNIQLVFNPNGTAPATFTSGNVQYTYDNQWTPANSTTLNGNGILFSSGAGGDTINIGGISGSGPANYFFSAQNDPTGPLLVSFNPNGSSPGAVFQMTAVPEPINWALGAFGLVFVGGSVGWSYLSRRRSATAS